ncbi:hypothetical protein ACIQM4_28445 [Streptomyces sp. NPDC091272]|uniref:hypothetical protein n=1 Tax=Streptomyces sp. NPDC091272 TaxID=3365981 RepID=UPI0037FD6038
MLGGSHAAQQERPVDGVILQVRGGLGERYADLTGAVLTEPDPPGSSFFGAGQGFMLSSTEAWAGSPAVLVGSVCP